MKERFITSLLCSERRKPGSVLQRSARSCSAGYLVPVTPPLKSSGVRRCSVTSGLRAAMRSVHAVGGRGVGEVM
ncbi:hypothetical protein EYF80_057886 [Liparis tanakae]|uniref:Uncharacterized protein n=1 Tax=Liparis tanakae TaxID=230148 RepID=A0A4Z2ETP7_9TELE|nr:hypothetical protein EYF80_057886 [Liparis tanakae]